MKNLFITLIIILLITGCAAPPEKAAPRQEAPDKAIETTAFYLDSRITIRRFVDIEAGVVCWIVISRAISCLPISETKLHEESR